MHPVSHGCAGSKEYQSSAFFVRHDPTGKEFLFFGDVEPDSLSSNPQNIHVWNIAAPKFPTELSTIFIECSYTCERKDSELYGHLSPKHLVDELVAFAEEVYKYRTPTSSSSTRRTSKKQKVAVDPRALRGILIGLRVVIIHCKDDMRSRVPPRQTILEQVRALVYAKGLGAEVIAAEQGMHLSERLSLNFITCTNYVQYSDLAVFSLRTIYTSCTSISTVSSCSFYFSFRLE